jgi:acyl-coenzyme A thioesterase PaaI-like protein
LLNERQKKELALRDDDMPDGYVYEPTPAAFIEHVGRLHTRKVEREDGTDEAWSALKILPHHVNAWNFAHGGVLATMAEIGTAQASWDPDGPACVAIDLAIQFISAPKLGDVLEVCGVTTKRTRSLVFASARGEVAGETVFIATSIQKVVGK